MKSIQRTARPVAHLVLICLVGLSSYVPAGSAAIISTESVANAQRVDHERDRLSRLLERNEVKSYLLANGVDPSSAKARIENLTDTEIHALASRLDDHPAGQDVGAILTIAFLVFLTLLITDILGYTDIFPFVKKSAK